MAARRHPPDRALGELREWIKVLSLAADSLAASGLSIRVQIGAQLQTQGAVINTIHARFNAWAVAELSSGL